jgi:hypothetical protein
VKHRPEFLAEHLTALMIKKTVEVKHFNECTVSCLVYIIILAAERSHIVGGNGRFPSETLRTGKADVGKG